MYTNVSCMLIHLQKSEDAYSAYVNLLDEEDDDDVDITLQTGLLQSYAEKSTTDSRYVLR